jgi:hypothetical protein
LQQTRMPSLIESLSLSDVLFPNLVLAHLALVAALGADPRVVSFDRDALDLVPCAGSAGLLVSVVSLSGHRVEDVVNTVL